MSCTADRKANRVLVISEHFPPPTVGGTATYTYNLCKYLAEIGWEVYLITQPSGTDIKARWYSQHGINIYRLDIPGIFTKKVFFPRSFPIYLLKRIHHIIAQLHPDIIHFSAGWYPLMVTRLYAGFTRIPIIWTIHNLPPAEHHLNIIRNNKLNKPLELLYFKLVKTMAKAILRFCRYNRIIAVSEATADKITKVGISASTIRVIQNAIDTQYLAAPANRRRKQANTQHVVLTVAGIVEHKGQLNIVKSTPEVVAKFPRVLFLLVGPIVSKRYFDLLKKTIRVLGLEQNVKLIGAVSQQDLLSYYQFCDLYLQPSLEEGFCITMLEAMACRKPVIGTPVGEISKLITESRAGILISGPSPGEIARAVIELLADEKARRESGERARKYVADNYSWEAVARQIADSYREAIVERTKR